MKVWEYMYLGMASAGWVIGFAAVMGFAALLVYIACTGIAAVMNPEENRDDADRNAR